MTRRGAITIAWLALVAGCAATPPAPTLIPAAAAVAAPPLAFARLDGTAWTTADIAGHVAVLDVWASYCKPCRKAFPVLDELGRSRPELRVIGISIDEDDASVHRFLRAVPAEFVIVRDRDSTATEGALAINKIPTLLVIDRRGRVRLRIEEAKAADYAALGRLVDTLLAEP